MKEFVIRLAKPEDSNEVAKLIYMTGLDLFLYMFGKNSLDVLAYLFQRKNNLFSYEHCRIIDIEEQIAGMILSYEFEAIIRESRNTGRLILKYYGIGFIPKVINLIKMDRIISDLTDKDYYISNIALNEGFRGYGFGKRLIEVAVEEAKKYGKRYVSLDVESNNENAINFYYHLGFKNVGEKTINFGFNRRVSLIRMVREC